MSNGAELPFSVPLLIEYLTESKYRETLKSRTVPGRIALRFAGDTRCTRGGQGSTSGSGSGTPPVATKGESTIPSPPAVFCCAPWSASGPVQFDQKLPPHGYARDQLIVL